MSSEAPRAGPRRLPPYLLRRPRLLARLDSGARLTVLRAPAGFGKTTLVRQWLQQRPADAPPVAWVRVRGDAGDAADFWIALVDALSDAGVPMPSLAAQRSPRALAERMLATRDHPLLLVIDGFENVTRPGPETVLLDALWDAPGLRVIVCLRDHHHFADTGPADLDAVVIGPQELLFTPAETAELAGLVGADLPPAVVASLHRDSGGWPEPTRAFVLAARGVEGDKAETHRVAQRVADEFLRQRLLPDIGSPELTDFLLRTSLARELTVEIAELLTDDPSVKTYVEWLERNGVLRAVVLEGGEPAYCWPAAARRALMGELRRRDPERTAELHARLARYYVGHDQPGRALRHAYASQQPELIVHVIDHAWLRLIYTERELLHEALAAVPVEVLATSQRAVAVLSMRVGGRRVPAIDTSTLPADPAALAELGCSDRAAELLDVGLAVLIALRRRGLFDQARSYGDRLLDLCAVAMVARTGEVAGIAPSVRLHAAIARVLAGDLNGALEPLQLAYESAAHSPLDNVAYDATAVLALVHAVAGETRRAETWLRRNLALPLPGTWVAPHTRRSADAARRLIALDRLEVEPVTGDDAPFDHRVNELWPLTTFADALHATLAGMPLEALDLIDRARAAHRDWLDHGAVATPLLVAAEVDALLVTGRGNEARRVLATAPDSDPMLQVSQARLALLTGQPHAARRLASDSTWTRRATVRHRLEMLLIHAVAAARTGDRDAATERIGRAVDGVRMTGAVRILTTVARAELAPLLDAAPGAADVLAEPSLADAADLFPAGVTLIDLTRGEGRVLDLLARGLTLQQVADTLVVSYNTVKTQQRSLYRKLGTNSRPDAIARARHLGLI